MRAAVDHSLTVCQGAKLMNKRSFRSSFGYFFELESSKNVLCELHNVDKLQTEAISYKTYTRLLQQCMKSRDLIEGKLVHANIADSGIKVDMFLGTTLVNMYVTCGSVEAAREVFDRITEPDVLLWNVMISAYSKDGHAEEAFVLFCRMVNKDVEPNEITFVGILKASGKLEDLEKGRQIHAHILLSGVRTNIFMENALLDMYVKCGSIWDACDLFNSMTGRDTVSWNTVICGWSRHCNVEKANAFLRQMASEGMLPNEVTYLGLLNGCASLEDLELGKQIHAEISCFWVKVDVPLRNALIDMYCKCGDLENACRIFNMMCMRDVITWNIIIAGHAKNACAEKALVLFLHMRHEGLVPDETTFVSILHACIELGNLEQGKQVHMCALQSVGEPNTSMHCALVQMYAEFAYIEHARLLFEKSAKLDVFLWTVMIGGYGRHGNLEEAVNLFHQMEMEGISPTEATFVSLVDACTTSSNMEIGQGIHAHMLEYKFESNILLGNSLINMYGKLGHADDAFRIFDKMGERNYVSFTAMIAAFAADEQCGNAFLVFKQMILGNVQPDMITYTSIVNLCGDIAALDEGRLVHIHIITSEIVLDLLLENALIDMYAKCGSLNEALCVLNKMSKRDLISWTTMLTAFAQHGQGQEAVQLITRMQLEQVKLNGRSFIAILSACSHSGLINEGCHYFESIPFVYGITPMVDHYACIVDLLGRAGHLDVAEGLIQRMPFQPNGVVWGPLLASCKIHGFVDLAEYASEQLLLLEPDNTVAFVVLSNLYAASGEA